MNSAIAPAARDLVSDVLKWVLFAVALLTFALLAWATLVTYEKAPPLPDRLIGPSRSILMTGDSIAAGKAGFQKADLMDYGSLYGMGSYYGEDYTALLLNRLGLATRNRIAEVRFGKPYAQIAPEQQAISVAGMQTELQGVDLSRTEVAIPAELAGAIGEVRDQMAANLNSVDRPAGWTPAYSLGKQGAQLTADFLVYSALTTVARRPGTTWSWTENWPAEPLVGNTPTTNTFRWTWISFCFTFSASA